MISANRLEALLAWFPRLTVGLVGDLFLDRYLDIDPELHELSIETGLEAYQITRVRNSPGALGTVVNNLVALGVGKVVVTSVIGDDGQAFDVLKALGQLGVGPFYVVRDPARLTPTYTKPMKRGEDGIWTELNRLDLRNRTSLSAETEDRLIAQLDEVFQACDGLIVTDQVNEDGWGVITERVRAHLAELIEGQPDKLVLVDSRQRVGQFRGATLKPNLTECARALGHEIAPDDYAANEAVKELANKTNSRVFCTCGERGMLVVEPGGELFTVAGFPVEGPTDPVGAGDSATAGIAAALLSGATPEEAATIGNLVASITVAQLGTTGTATPQQVLARWEAAQ